MSGCSCSDEVERLFGGSGAQDLDLAPLEREPEADRLHDVGLVVHDQDPHPAESGGPAAGTTRVNRLPVPGRSHVDAAPCAWAIARAVAQAAPRPVRLRSAGRRRTARTGAAGRRPGSPAPGRSPSRRRTIPPWEHNGDRAVPRAVLQGIGDEVDEGLAPVGGGRRTRGGAPAREVDRLGGGPRGAQWRRRRRGPSRSHRTGGAGGDVAVRNRVSSSMSATTRCIRSAFRSMVARRVSTSSGGGRRGRSRSTPTQVRIAVSGVRSSWAIVERRSVRSRSSSASC